MRRLTPPALWIVITPAVLALFATLVAAHPAAGKAAGPQITAYTNNVENLLTKTEKCEGDWAELSYFIAERPAPDLILLQQVTDKDQVYRFIEHLEDNSSADYSGMVADTEPDGGGGCGSEKAKQLNAIVWNTASMSYVKGSKAIWQSMRENPDSGGSQCVKNDQSRTVNLKAVFRHSTGQTVTAASVHWPTQASGNFLCADNSARDLDARLKRAPYRDSALQIVGGDMNYGDVNTKGEWCKWYRQLRQDGGFADAARGLCGPNGSCNDSLWTHITDGKKRRIDYLFARRGTSVPALFLHGANVTFASAQEAEARHHDESDAGCHTYPGRSGCFYSEHRAVTGTLL